MDRNINNQGDIEACAFGGSNCLDKLYNTLVMSSAKSPNAIFNLSKSKKVGQRNMQIMRSNMVTQQAKMTKEKIKNYTNCNSLNMTKNDSKKPRKRCSSRFKEFSVAVNPKLQSKIDYFITPYNNTLHCNKHMEIEDSRALYSSMDGRDSSKWEKLMDFITKQDKLSFRQSLNSINNRLYMELIKMVERKWPNLKQKTNELEEL